MTAEIRRLRAAARRMRLNGDSVKSVRHVFTRAYCVAKPAPLCAVFAVPSMDCEPQVKDTHFVTVQNETASSVSLGDWCSLAYLSTSHSGMPYVIQELKEEKG